MKEYMKEYRKRNKQKIGEYQRQYHQKNKEKASEYQREYRQTPKGKKANLISSWKCRGIISEDFDELYGRYITTEKCEFCGVILTADKNNTSTTRCLDHEHETGQVRGVLCMSCNIKDVLDQND